VKVLEDIAKQTNKYGNEDWVKFASATSECTSEPEYDSEHEHENVVHRRPLLPCSKKDKDKRHRFQHNFKSWRDDTVGYILVFLGVIIF